MIKDLCFEIIQKCPNHCLFCSSNSSYQQNNIIDYPTIKNTIDFFVAHGGIKEISLSGGEPLLHPNVLQIIQLCHDRGIYTTLYTSGVMENPTKQQFSNITSDVLSKLKAAGLAEKTKLKIGVPLLQHNTHKCTAGFDKIDIRYDGQILPCPAFKDTAIKLLQKHGFPDINIYRNLEDFKFVENESRVSPLCQQIHEEKHL